MRIFEQLVKASQLKHAMNSLALEVRGLMTVFKNLEGVPVSDGKLD
jgi:hypothetical protein